MGKPKLVSAWNNNSNAETVTENGNGIRGLNATTNRRKKDRKRVVLTLWSYNLVWSSNVVQLPYMMNILPVCAFNYPFIELTHFRKAWEWGLHTKSCVSLSGYVERCCTNSAGRGWIEQHFTLALLKKNVWRRGGVQVPFKREEREKERIKEILKEKHIE